MVILLAGLGDRFKARLGQVFRLICSYPEAFPAVFQSYRQARVLRFPFVVIYEPREEHIEILAVFHTCRDPEVWQDRAR